MTPRSRYFEQKLISDLLYGDVRFEPDLIERALIGDAAAHFEIGERYYNHVEYDHAVTWFRIASKRKYAPAQCMMGICYRYGDGVPINYSESLNWLFDAADQGDSEAMYEIADIYIDGDGLDANHTVALEMLKNAAELENSDAKYRIGELYENGLVVEKDKNEALMWFHRSADLSNMAAHLKIQQLNEEGYCIDSRQSVILSMEREIRELKQKHQEEINVLKNWAEHLNQRLLIMENQAKAINM